jgi:formylglycine-generating enzyme
MRVRALASGGAFGVLSGWLWVMSHLVPAVRSEALAARPAPSSPAAAPSAKNADPHHAEGSKMVPDRPAEAADASEALQRQASAPRNVSLCGEGMRLVEGDYCTTLVHRCIEPFKDGSGRCNRYTKGARCYPPVLAMRYCIDEFEYPNRRGEKPQVMVSFVEAKSSCERENKRLCTAREWTLACEGPDRLPYPNGNIRDRAACNIDQPHRFPDAAALNDTRLVTHELERLDQRTPSGSMPGCVSPFGVEDMVGNVDEWVISDGSEEAAGLGAQTVLKGGYFGAVRARCRPATPSHGPTFRFYQVGFRCCRNDTPDPRGSSVGELAGHGDNGAAELPRFAAGSKTKASPSIALENLAKPDAPEATAP